MVCSRSLTASKVRNGAYYLVELKTTLLQAQRLKKIAELTATHQDTVGRHYQKVNPTHLLEEVICLGEMASISNQFEKQTL